MPYLQLENTQFPLFEGETRVGKGDSADVQLATGSNEIDAVITVTANMSASVRRESPASRITVNGIVLATQPSPLFHGDRLSIGDFQLLYADEAQTGATRQVAVVAPSSGPAPARPVRAKRSGEGVPTKGGRLVSLMDGREYPISDKGMTIGRAALCDIVIAASDVSRRHARVEVGPQGYVLVDSSTNGVLVNGEVVSRSHPLMRGDMIQIGPEEFRFHAEEQGVGKEIEVRELLVEAPKSQLLEEEIRAPEVGGARPKAGEKSPSPPVEPSLPSANGAVAAPTPPISTTAANARPLLATFEVINEGPTKGTRFRVESQLVHVGRGGHNDIVISDESVSDSHAKIQRRETGWFVVDMDSTNGTYVGGQRVAGEAPLLSGSDVRFGGVKLTFRVTGSVRDETGGTRVIVGYRSRTPVVNKAVETPEQPEMTAESGGRWSGMLLSAVLILVFIVAFLILRAL